MKNFRATIFFDVAVTAIILTLSTLLGALFRAFSFHDTNIVLLYVFSVLLIALFTKGYFFGILSAVVCLLLFNWFFTEPYYTFKVNDLTYLITFAVMALTAIVTSALTTKVKQSATDARQRETESNALYQMTNHLTDAEDAAAIAEIVVRTTGNILSCNTACICFDEKGEPEKTFLQGKDDGSVIRRELTDGEELRARMEKLHGNVDVGETSHDYPIYGKSVLLAVLRIPQAAAAVMTESQTRMMHSVIESASMALERLRSLYEQAKSREETAQERYRGNLLRAISHDIRTPLSGIMGASEMLMSKTQADEGCYALAKDVYQDAEWLHGLVENILNLTKLQDGKLILDKQPEALEEVIGAALMVMERRIPDRTIDVEMPENVVIAPMDARLISQVLINLLDNATQHTDSGCTVKISVRETPDDVEITVADNGKGIAKKDLPHIFQTFYTTSRKNADSKRGVGLGLAICQSIVEAHGGKIRAENRPEGGAAFIFTLPLGGKRQ